MRDVVKTNVKREQNSKRVRRRKKKISLYIFMIFIIVIGIGILLSVTLLFNINVINIKGDVDYSDDTVLEASGLSKGDNLVRLDANEAERKILSSMIYIEEASISKKYPDTLEINLTKCVPAANVEYDDGYLLISKKGKILENVKEARTDCFTIKGIEAQSYDLGGYIQSSDEQKTKIYTEILDALSKYEDHNVTLIDMTDKFDIVINYDNRINFELGNANDISYKIKLADTVLKDIDETKKGTMVMVGANQISFRTEGGIGSTSEKKTENDRIPINQETLPEGSTMPEAESFDEDIDENEENFIDNEGNNDEYADEAENEYEESYDNYEYEENGENYDDFVE